MSDLWFPGAALSHKAPVDGGSILGGKPKCLWHSTETNGLPSYSTDYWPNMTICGGVPYQHIPANRAGRALKNPAGGVETNRWNVFQIEVCGHANTIAFHPVMADVAQWLYEARGCPLTEDVDWLAYSASYGATRVRLSGAAWESYSGHLGHMHAPENDHGDPGWPFPIQQILSGGDWLSMATQAEVEAAVRKVLNKESIPGDAVGGSFGSKLKDVQGGVDRMEPVQTAQGVTLNDTKQTVDEIEVDVSLILNLVNEIKALLEQPPPA